MHPFSPASLHFWIFRLCRICFPSTLLAHVGSKWLVKQVIALISGKLSQFVWQWHTSKKISGAVAQHLTLQGGIYAEGVANYISMFDLCNVVVLIPVEFAAVLACLSFNQYTPQHLVLQVRLSIQDALHDSTFRLSLLTGSSLPTGASSLNSCTWLVCFERTWRQRFEEFFATFASSSSSWFIWFGVINLSFAGYRWTAIYTNQ